MEYRSSELGGKKPHQQMMIGELTPSYQKFNYIIREQSVDSKVSH